MKLEEYRQLRSERLSFMTGAGPVVDDGFVSALRALLASKVSKKLSQPGGIRARVIESPRRRANPKEKGHPDKARAPGLVQFEV
jgi:hypothetical protein